MQTHVYQTPFGECLIATEDEVVHRLEFTQNEPMVLKDDKFIKKIFSKDTSNINIVLDGTEFEIKVWQAILTIPFGHTATYSDIANLVGMPKAVRAVASAVGRNKISYLIPCHRIVRKSNEIYNYRWGSKFKKALLEWEKNILDTESKLLLNS